VQLSATQGSVLSEG